MEQAARQVSADGTVKLLLRLSDGEGVECVLMPDYRPDRAAACLSCQAGCALGCAFCATGQGGFRRDLAAEEMLAQFRALRGEARALGRQVTTAVFMGMGEPLLNLPAVLDVVRALGAEGVGPRQVMVSTAGLPEGIAALAESGLRVKLAVSLHAPDDETRARLLPAAKPISDILEAASGYQKKTKRTVTVEYCLLKNVNDSFEQARKLAALLKGRRFHVNLIRYSRTEAVFDPSSEEARFLDELRSRGIVAHPRRQRGTDIAAACGQLRGAGS